MSKRVETGCRDCKRCNNSGMAELGRKLGKATVVVSTGGMSLAAQAFTGNCRGCGHKKSLHNQPAQGVPTTQAQPVVQAPPVVQQTPAPGWYPVAGGQAWWDGQQWTGHFRQF